MTTKSVLRSLLPKRVRPHRIWKGPLRGRSIVTSWHDYPGAILGYTESPLLHWLAANVREGHTWLDVGAHYGYIAMAMSTMVGDAGRIFAFEPMLATAGHLNATRTLNALSQLTVVPLGLSAAPHLRSTSVPTARGMADHARLVGCHRETIYHVALDSVWAGLSGDDQRIHGVKIDVQGMELEVLKGMRQVLRTLHPKVVLEVHPGVDRTAMLDIFHESGYSRYGSNIDELDAHDEHLYRDDHSYVFVSEPTPAEPERRPSLAVARAAGADTGRPPERPARR